MKFKKVLFVAIIATTMMAIVACGDVPDGDNTPGINEDPITNGANENEAIKPEPSGVEVVAQDGTYTGFANTLDEKGQIEVELTIVDSQVTDFQVTEQEGIELTETTIENFRVQLMSNKPINETLGDQDEVDLLMQASISALNQSI